MECQVEDEQRINGKNNRGKDFCLFCTHNFEPFWQGKSSHTDEKMRKGKVWGHLVPELLRGIELMAIST